MNELITEHALIPDIVSFNIEDGYVLNVMFEDGETRKFDFTPLLQWNCYSRLKDKGFFNCAKLEYGTIVWPGNIDIDPEIVYCR